MSVAIGYDVTVELKSLDTMRRLEFGRLIEDETCCMCWDGEYKKNVV